MKPAGGAAIAVAALLLAACAGLPAAPPTADIVLTGYLADTVTARLAAEVPPPSPTPTPADRAGSDAYRTLEGGDRWLMAVTHAEFRPPFVAQQFDCAVGARMTAQPMPALTRLMTRLQIDTVATGGLARGVNPRLRPAVVDPQRRVCIRLTEAGRAAPSWPSIAAAVGTAYADLFSDLAPDRSVPVQRIGREIGLSRAVCGLDWPSDVSAGAGLGHTVYAAVASTPAFQDDLALARVEVTAVRSAAGPESPGCAAERRLFPSDARRDQAGRGAASAP
ncbi:MAG: acid phosphatase (class A) [Brevundimonas sp.]|uniref:PA-phosphatase n=1 Tax=Brevundimonas sp. TaxID=1871086 RepID=UPI0039E6331B